MLGDGNEDRLMVGGRVDRGEFIRTSGETGSNISCELAIDGGRIQTLEESEHLRIVRGRLCNGGQGLNNDMRVALDLALRIEELGGSEVIFRSIHEETSLHSFDGHCDGESSVRLDGVTVLGGDEFGGGHVIGRRDDTHWSWVT